MVKDKARSELEARIIGARDDLVNYFDRIPGFRASSNTIHGTHFQAVANVCHPYSGGIPQISGNEFKLDFKGRKDVCLKVTFEEEVIRNPETRREESRTGKVRVLVNGHLNEPIYGTPNEARRAIELHERVREYISGVADFYEEHGTRDGHTQLRYYLKPKHNP